jgi:hypothetical protein
VESVHKLNSFVIPASKAASGILLSALADSLTAKKKDSGQPEWQAKATDRVYKNNSRKEQT